MTWGVVTALVVALALAAGGSDGAAPNVRGILVRAAAPPACPRDEPCDPPATGAFLVFARGGRVTARVAVGAGGAFALHVRAGTYTVQAAPPPLTGTLTPSTIRVPPTGVIHLRLVIRELRPPAPS